MTIGRLVAIAFMFAVALFVGLLLVASDDPAKAVVLTVAAAGCTGVVCHYIEAGIDGGKP